MKFKRLKKVSFKKGEYNSNARVNIPCWSITPRAKDILTLISQNNSASRSFVFEKIVANTMFLSSIGLFTIKNKSESKSRTTYIPRLRMHQTYIDYILEYEYNAPSSSTVSNLIESYFDKYKSDIYILSLC